MKKALRQRWDTYKDMPHECRDIPNFEQRHRDAVSIPIPPYRARLVELPGAQFELTVVPVDPITVINARVGFNPPLDRPRREENDYTPEEWQERQEKNKQRSAQRARQKVRYLTKSMQADHMLTFSYRENVDDRERVARDWKEFVRLFRFRYKDWQYVSVLELQDRGAFHIHVAVRGRQDIRWLLRCWLLAIGQTSEDVSQWVIHGEHLGEKSLGAVNVEPPKKRWGSGRIWKSEKLSGYLTKYISKEFEETEKGAKKYWASRNIEKPVITRFWLHAQNYKQAIEEAHDLIYYKGVTDMSMWGDSVKDVIWITAEIERSRIGQCTQSEPDFEVIE